MDTTIPANSTVDKCKEKRVEIFSCKLHFSKRNTKYKKQKQKHSIKNIWHINKHKTEQMPFLTAESYEHYPVTISSM